MNKQKILDVLQAQLDRARADEDYYKSGANFNCSQKYRVQCEAYCAEIDIVNKYSDEETPVSMNYKAILDEQIRLLIDENKRLAVTDFRMNSDSEQMRRNMSTLCNLIGAAIGLLSDGF